MGFFHPFPDGGGGGERVLWCAVKAVQEASPRSKIFIYARQGVVSSRLAEDAASRFNIQLHRPVVIVPLEGTHLIQSERYRRFTLAGQALGSIKLGWEALNKRVPQVRPFGLTPGAARARVLTGLGTWILRFVWVLCGAWPVLLCTQLDIAFIGPSQHATANRRITWPTARGLEKTIRPDRWPKRRSHCQAE